MVKSLSLLTRKAGMTHEQFVKHWVEVDGIAELWFDDADALARGFASPEGKARHADGALFIGRIKSYTTEERVIVG